MFEVTVNHDFRPNDYCVSGGRIFVTAATMAQRQELGYLAKNEMRRRGLVTTFKPCRLFLYINRRQDPMKKYFGDCDNFCKWVCDALTGVVYFDDAQLQEVHIFKLKVKEPSLTVRIEEI